MGYREFGGFMGDLVYQSGRDKYRGKKKKQK